VRENHSLALEDGRFDDAQELLEQEARLESELEDLRTGWDRSNSPVVTATTSPNWCRCGRVCR